MQWDDDFNVSNPQHLMNCQQIPPKMKYLIMRNHRILIRAHDS